MGSRADRAAENQRTSRDANRRLHDLARVPDGALIPFLCECADSRCLGRIAATVGEFEVIHEDEDRFFIVPGHRRVEGESVLDGNTRYAVVAKG